MSEDAISGIRRALGLLKVLGSQNPQGMRLTDIAAASGISQPSAHRALKALMAEGFVEQTGASRKYRLALDFFVLAAQAAHAGGLRSTARPALLRLSSTLSDSVFLLVRNGFDAVCLDRVEGPFPIRTFTGDIGGKVPLGIGQGSLAILSFLPEDERETIIRFNVPRLLDRGSFDEVGLRMQIQTVRRTGYASLNTGLIPGMAGVGVPIFDAEGRAVAALSIGTLSERLEGDRLPLVVELLQKEADGIGRQLNPFDPTLRYPTRSLGTGST
ncbi:IclR family transcriptional regulator [Microvirga makkahensis]|uniref:Helix-turn-helix domain-containing protein n=1 Tax=Microvirga makkahensis TaxID=1128670 RepID=A0A7X3MWS1_9HYPH|nr:IclR family transcriptional regulator [Microvirga makkahensis]MXQ14641.1 helix-turn-helix domain-containing protein [Microvirga makkahensis]